MGRVAGATEGGTIKSKRGTGGMIMIRPSDVVLHKPTGETWEIGE